jgi:putative copper export protein
MLPDVLSATLRSLSFIAMAQAAGAVLFTTLAAGLLNASRAPVRRIAMLAAAAGLLLLPMQFALEAARMAGDMAGAMDLSLQRFALSTAAATVLAVRVAALLLILVAVARGGAWAHGAGIAGTLLIAVSFALTGHTATAPVRWLLGPMAVLHVAIVCFWFGALWPLLRVAGAEPADVAARVVGRFSWLASRLVPGILLAGIVLMAGLLPDMRALRDGYGLALLVKLGAFALLMWLAAWNKWRLGPALARGGAGARRRFALAVGTEMIVIAVVLAGTAVLTTFGSP